MRGNILFPLVFTICFLLSLSLAKDNLCEKLIYDKLSESEIMKQIDSNMHILKVDSSRCLETLLKHGKFTSLEYFLNELSKRGIKFRESLNSAMTHIERRIEELHNRYRFDDEDYQVVSPAFQWAQSLDTIFLQIKFAHRHDSPGCLEVKNHVLDLQREKIIFKAYCVIGDVPIKFELNLDLFGEISDIESKGDFGSVGRYVITLKKAPARYWKNLYPENYNIPSNMKVWWEMKEKYESEIKSYEDKEEEDEDAEIEELKKRAERSAQRKREKQEKKEKRAREKAERKRLEEPEQVDVINTKEEINQEYDISDMDEIKKLEMEHIGENKGKIEHNKIIDL
jgi:hypothetical protein